MADEFAEELDSFMRDNGYENRSEALRDLARNGLDRASSKMPLRASVSPACSTCLITAFEKSRSV